MNWHRMVGLTVGVGTVLGLACSLTASVPATRLRRYVSDPLPDGRRYTFLYPDRLHLERPADPDPGLQVRLLRRINAWQALSSRAVMTELFWSADNEAEEICVCTVSDSGGSRTGRWQMNQASLRSRYYLFQAYFRDDKKQLFNFTYRWNASQNRWCAPASSQIVDSFRILAPGEAPPVDAAPRAVTASKERSSAGNSLAGR